MLTTPYDARRGEATLAAALGEWRSTVQEPPLGAPDPIRRYLAACGFSGAQTYHADGDAEWCGAFAAYCLIAAGADPAILRQQDPEHGGLGSTYRAMRLTSRVPARLISRADDLRVGDVAIVGRTGRRTWGEHIVIVSGAVSGGRMPTVEGNARGLLGDGTSGEGVVRRMRMIDATTTAKGFVFGVRLTSSDYLEVT